MKQQQQQQLQHLEQEGLKRGIGLENQEPAAPFPTSSSSVSNDNNNNGKGQQTCENGDDDQQQQNSQYNHPPNCPCILRKTSDNNYGFFLPPSLIQKSDEHDKNNKE